MLFRSIFKIEKKTKTWAEIIQARQQYTYIKIGVDMNVKIKIKVSPCVK